VSLEHRKPRSVPGALFLLAPLLLVVLGPAAARAGVETAGTSAMFRLSPVRAAVLPGGGSIRFSVTVRNATATDRPGFRWYLRLAATPSAACENGRLAGGERLTGGKLVWANQGSAFVWFQGPGLACRGTVSVVAENEYGHCKASYVLSAVPTEPAAGAPAQCALGGFTIGQSTLPVPAALLSTYANVDAELAKLAAELRQGKLARGALKSTIAPVMQSQAQSFTRLFPPVWGCSFATAFDGLVVVQQGFAEQVATLGAGGSVPAATLAGDGRSMQTAAQALRGCAGVPHSVVNAFAPLVTESAALPTEPHAQLAAKLGALESGVEALLDARFPKVFGMSYGELVGRVAGENAAVAAAEQAATASAAAAGLAGAIAPAHAIRQGLLAHQRHVIAVENANG